MRIILFLLLTGCATAGCGTDDLFCATKKDRSEERRGGQECLAVGRLRGGTADL